MDNLTATILAAQKAGMSYGQYVALHGVKSKPKRKRKPKYPTPMKKCPECGNEFPAIGHKAVATYCSSECQEAHNRRAANKRYYEKKKLERTSRPTPPPNMFCPECGKEFSPVGRKHNVVYCTPECQVAHNKKTIKEQYHERKKGNSNE